MEMSMSVNHVLKDEDDYLDFMLEAEHHEDDYIQYDGNIYQIGDILSFIRDYTFDVYSQNRNLDDAIDNGLLIHVGEADDI